MGIRKINGRKEKAGYGIMKNGFSLMEVFMLIFIIAVISAVIFPLKIIDINQAERIAKWKSYFFEIKYCYEIMLNCEKEYIEIYKKDILLNSDGYFGTLAKYIGQDGTKSANTNFSKYKKRFMNGRIVRKTSKYYTTENIYLKNNMIASFVSLERKTNTDPLGILFIDIDGSMKRNFIGRDIFAVLIYTDRLEPYGFDSTRQKMKQDCSPVGSGLQCSAYYLVGGNF